MDYAFERVTEDLKISSVHILCDDTEAYEDKLPKQIVLHKDFERLLQSLKKSLLKLDFPVFAPIFDYKGISKVNKLYYYLTGLLIFTNREQAKEDLLELAQKLFINQDELNDFNNTYVKYDMRTVLKWYTKDSFLHKLINSCLRISTSDSILYCRLIIRDLQTAIKDSFQQKEKKYAGPVYRGCYLSDEEWNNLKDNHGKEIEMYGFLSTSKRKDRALLNLLKMIPQEWY